MRYDDGLTGLRDGQSGGDRERRTRACDPEPPHDARTRGLADPLVAGAEGRLTGGQVLGDEEPAVDVVRQQGSVGVVGAD